MECFLLLFNFFFLHLVFSSFLEVSATVWKFLFLSQLTFQFCNHFEWVMGILSHYIAAISVASKLCTSLHAWIYQNFVWIHNSVCFSSLSLPLLISISKISLWIIVVLVSSRLSCRSWNFWWKKIVLVLFMVRSQSAPLSCRYVTGTCFLNNRENLKVLFSL